MRFFQKALAPLEDRLSLIAKVVFVSPSVTQTDILPVAQNSGAIWPRKTFLKRPGLITLSIGPVISVQGKTEEQLQLEVEAWIEGEMRRLDPSAYKY